MPSTKKVLLDEALRVFGRRGYVGATLRDIAAAANVTPAVILYYFPSKESLFLRTGEFVCCEVDRRLDELERRLDDAEPKLHSLLANLLSIIDVYIDLAVMSPDAIRFLLWLHFGPHHSHPALNIEPVCRRTSGLAARVLGDAVDSGQIVLRSSLTVPLLSEIFVGAIGHLVFNEVNREPGKRICRAKDRRNRAAARGRARRAIRFFLLGAGTICQGGRDRPVASVGHPNASASGL